MADSITLQPAVTMAADRQPRQQQDRHGEEREPAPGAPAPTQTPAPEASSPPAVIDEPAVVAETLFSASILGQRLRSVAADLRAVALQREQGWTPPDSALPLKDKSI